MPKPFFQLLHSPLLWRGDQLAHARAVTPTGFSSLDHQLPGGGWPLDAIVEVMLDQPGIGEMQLFFPALRQVLKEAKKLVIVSPPYLPYPPAFHWHGIDLSQVIFVHASGEKNNFWAFEQALSSASCGAAFIWVSALEDKVMRRLQLAASKGSGLAIVFRPSSIDMGSPWAALRLHLFAEDGDLGIRILKRRGGGLPSPMRLSLRHALDMSTFS